MATKTRSRTSRSSSTKKTSTPAPAKWPSKGFTGKQPWEREDPPHVTHSMPQLASGSAGPEVLELGRRLAELDYETSVSQGANPFNVVGPSEMAAVNAFRRDYNVIEDPSGYTEAEDDARRHVGPWTWEALLSLTKG